MEFTLSPAAPADYSWLWELKRLTMRPYVEQTWGSWDDESQEAFFRRNFSPRTVSIVAVSGEKVGLLEVEQQKNEIFLANIQILPAFQNRGLGTAVVQNVLECGRALRLPVRLQVLQVNQRAQSLYARLGFQPAEQTPTHVVMRWQPE